jgi:pantetheine-phosphate adenylyltransferase
MTRIAIYPGSFDPPTRGHEDLIRRCRSLADRVLVAIAQNSAKQPLLTVAERTELLRELVGDDPAIEIVAFDGLLATYAREVGATMVIRGLRAVGDFEYEFQMALMNRQLHPGLETIFLAPASHLTFVSSTLVREVARFNGDLGDLVDSRVKAALARKFGR